MSLLTREHISRVSSLLLTCIQQLAEKSILHDKSKLEDPEKPIFDEYEKKLKGLEYGSDEYKATLEEMKPAIKHHYEVNRHHPEHYENGMKGMNLLDLLEMFCDWKAAGERHETGDIKKSIEVNQKRFGYSDDLKEIFLNTAELLKDS